MATELSYSRKRELAQQIELELMTKYFTELAHKNGLVFQAKHYHHWIEMVGTLSGYLYTLKKRNQGILTKLINKYTDVASIYLTIASTIDDERYMFLQPEIDQLIKKVNKEVSIQLKQKINQYKRKNQ